MTSPEKRRNRTSQPTVPQINFGAHLAALIPQVEIPLSFDAPRKYPISLLSAFEDSPTSSMLNVKACPPEPLTGSFELPVNSEAQPSGLLANAEAQLSKPVGSSKLSVNSGNQLSVAEARLSRPKSVLDIPEVKLPEGWNRLPQHPMPKGPLISVPPTMQRGRPRQLGPLHNISGGQADVAYNNIHRGHIALREKEAAHYRALTLHRQTELLKRQKEKKAAEQAKVELAYLKKEDRGAELERQRQHAEMIQQCLKLEDIKDIM